MSLKSPQDTTVRADVGYGAQRLEDAPRMDILIVDDSRAMRLIVKRTLRQAGYGDATVREAANGDEALAAVTDRCPDLVLSDWNMPGMNGLELLQAIKAQGLVLKFGFVTSEGTPEMRRRAADNGAAFLIAKPFNADVFAAKLAEVA